MSTRRLQKITFIVEEFALPSPAQQLLDRFLIGYPHEGTFRQLEGCRVAIHFASAVAPHPEIIRRVEDFGLTCESSVAAAVSDAEAVVIVGREQASAPTAALIKASLENSAANSACFVYGALADTLKEAKSIAELAASGHIMLASGTATAVTHRLPEVDVPQGTRLKEALIVVQGNHPLAELEALQGLLPLIERRQDGESGVTRIRFWQGPEIWRAGERALRSWSLLGHALSRSDRPQGDPVTDGRTQDLVGLGLVPQLARQPRGWLLEHRDGLRSMLLDLDGVVDDFNFAVKTGGGQIISAQLHRPPGVAQHQFSRLAGILERFFRTGDVPWPVPRSLLVAGLLELFDQLMTQKSETLQTPELGEIGYRVANS
jgi:hypothetical protein